VIVVLADGEFCEVFKVSTTEKKIQTSAARTFEVDLDNYISTTSDGMAKRAT
jgi:hypothetical protein